jgi:putative ABC transport system permease protein
VAAISLVIALGTGTYAALLSTSAWRTQSNDASFSLLHVHDLRIALTQGSTTAEGSLTRLVRSIPSADRIDAVRERLVSPIQVGGPAGLLVPGELVGSDITSPPVDGVSRSSGRSLTAADDGRLNFVVDKGFAQGNGLAPTGELTVSGGTVVHYVGQGQSPEYFLVSGTQGALPFLTQKSFAVLYSALHTAQRITGSSGRINDAVITLRPGANRSAIRHQLQQSLATSSSPMSATVTTRDDISAYRILYRDIQSDEQLWRIIAFLILGGAAFAALNLTTRIVEAQRREIGIGMALGVRDRQLALRPMLLGAQVAIAGVVLGLGVGWLVGIPLRSMFTNLVPLPIWRTPLQVGIFAQAALLGFALPFAAVVWPVWRAVHAQPVDAIRTGHLTAKPGAVSALVRIRLPGRSYRQAPTRNLVRTPRRTLLTALGIAAAVTTLVTVMGFLDTFNATLSRSEAELLHAAPNRVTAALSSFEPADGPVVMKVRSLPEVSRVDTGLLVPTTIKAANRSLDSLIQVLGPQAPWTPTIVSGRFHGGIVLASKAAADLNVGVGDTVVVEHPQASAEGLRTTQTKIRVAGIHPNPMRMLSYLDASSATALHLGSYTNVLTIRAAPGATADTVRRALLQIPQVASAESAKTATDGMRSSLDQYLGILRIAGGITLLLALLIAFNTTSIGMDERRREHATMMAFGLSSKTVVTLTVIEAALLGVLGTTLGILGGYGILNWMTNATIPAVTPELGVSATLTNMTILVTLLLGIGVVAAAPLLSIRRLRRLDVSSALRLVE